MTDYLAIILAGFFTGVGVIVAQKAVNWLDKHPIMQYFKERFNRVARGEQSLHDLMQEQRDLGKKIEEKIA